MAIRRPVIINASGVYEELPTGDTVPDSDALAGRADGQYVYGTDADCGSFRANTTWDGTDEDQYRAAFWDINAATWTPNTGWWWGITLPHQSNNAAYNYSGQIIIQNHANPEVYVRTISGGATPVANAWRFIWHDGNFTPSDYSITNHNHSGVYEPVFSKNTGFNLNLGTSAGTVSEGNHNHSGVYLGITAKAADSELLDNLNSTQFMRSDAEDTYSAAYLNLSSGGAAISFDDQTAPDGRGIKRVTCNDGGGNWNFLAGCYYNTAHQYVKTGDGAVQMFMDSDTANGAWRVRVAPTGTVSTNITWSTTFEVNTTGVSITGNPLRLNDNIIERPKLDDYAIVHSAPTISAGAITFNYNTSQSFAVSLTANITSITLSNPPASGNYGEIVIEFTQDATGGRTVTGWPASVDWAGGSAPTITTTASTGRDKIFLSTRDGGTTWLGDFSQDYS